ncbi:tripartite tricarboxylate transporter permease [Acuticoccus sp.]|uniref:tripartite tricarboxylate transporter permease n=1 Tax=Acuticoccus sp. TaxID=1904378 RepID=UPI003B5265F7
MIDGLTGALAHIFTPLPFFYVVLGTVLGIVVGAIPGLSGAMLIALTLPLTFYMEPVNAIVLLIGMYVGSITGGLITATLLRMPGTPSNVVTTFDGHPMAMAGRPGRALGLGIAASFVGGLVSWIVLLLLAKPLSIWATRFGPFEYFTLILMAMVLIASVSQGSMVKGLIAGFLGMLVSMPGVDPSAGQPRLTWDWYVLNGGLKLLPVLIGIFAVSQIIGDIVSIAKKIERIETSLSGMLMSLSDWRRQAVNLVRSSLIGTWVGILPGIGASIGSIMAYTAAKNMSRAPQEYGHGSEEGIVASEAANNATVGGALIPLIAMGIPGSVIDAILIGALMIHSIQPGPTLFLTNADVVWAMIAACLVANVIMYVVMMGSVRFVSQVMYVPRTFLLPIILVFCIIGAFALDNTMFDVWVMLGFGVLGFAMERAGFPLGPFVIGFVLAPLMEEKLRSGLMMTAGSIEPMFTRPLPLIFLSIALVLLVFPFVRTWREARAVRAAATSAPSSGDRDPTR